ncbi:hypothetical protein Q5H93_14810 [Hymenobacter sp. ASUV-10]|uniref:Uncharacterized protein n=1 Tax=Hymenobacter aranciens TaxID=3063996 RepID=A0ABT9BG57_9BACT|nr:hypothetical protein [Hymenobacter sp. ASUV-10]MDO7876012.1 hypothetical protein [Hymenobacter sp. ASUV-10]
MKLPLLDQFVLLARGEAGLLARPVAVLVRDVTRATRPVVALEMLSLTPLEALRKQLERVDKAEQAQPPKPGKRPALRKLRVPYDQLVALLHHRHALYHCGLSDEEHLRLHGVVGKFQQASLNLARYIKFPG